MRQGADFVRSLIVVDLNALQVSDQGFLENLRTNGFFGDFTKRDDRVLVPIAIDGEVGAAGNLARTLSRDLRCLIAAQPTRGLDVGAIEFVWEQLAAARDRGVAILLISTDLDEVMSMADRCCVIYRGRLVAEWPRARLDRGQLGLAMGGASDGGPPRTATVAGGHA